MKVDFLVDTLMWLSLSYHSPLTLSSYMYKPLRYEVHDLGRQGFPSFLGSSLPKLHNFPDPSKERIYDVKAKKKKKKAQLKPKKGQNI